MKKISLVALLFVITLNAFSQISIANTSWKGKFLAPRELDVILSFKNDSATVNADAVGLLALLVFSQKKDSLIVRKISGKSSCPEAMEGIYRIEWLEKGQKFLLHMLKDDCTERIKSFTTVIPFQKIRS